MHGLNTNNNSQVIHNRHDGTGPGGGVENTTVHQKWQNRLVLAVRCCEIHGLDLKAAIHDLELEKWLAGGGASNVTLRIKTRSPGITFAIPGSIMPGITTLVPL